MYADALKRVFEHPEQLLEVATRACCPTLLRKTFFQASNIFALQLECLTEAVIVLQARAAPQVVTTDARVCNFDRL